MNRRALSRTLLLLSFGTGALVLANACGGKPKTPSEAVRPGETSAKDALGHGNPDGGIGSANCSASDDDHALIIDLPDNDRREIEEMVKTKRVPIVKYDCATLTILKRCNLEATYEYTPISLDEKVISLDNADSASANIPLGTAGGVKASIATGMKVDLALAQVGSKRTKLQLVERQTLKGDRGAQDCDGASHYIYKLDVGAWALAQRTGAAVSAAAEVFTASASGDSKSNRSSGKSVGKLENCKNASDKDTAAPDNCGTPISIDLRRIEEKAKEAHGDRQGAGPGGTDGRIGNDTGRGSNATVTNASYVPPCPEGKVRAEAGACVAPSPNIKYICRGDDIEDCKAQCEKGVPESCVKEALFYSWGMSSKGGTKVERDPAKAIAILEPVCQKSTSGKGCTELAQAYTAPSKPGQQVSDENKKKANNALELGCKRSDPRSCYALGEFVAHPLLGVNDPERSVYWWDRGCKLGDHMSCLAAGRILIEGRKNLEGVEVVKKDTARGTEILEQSCKTNNPSACSMLGRYLTDGKQMKKDPKKAADLFKYLCDKKSTFGCVELALLQLTGEGTEAKPTEARATLEKFCNEDKYSTACYGVGLLSEKGLAGAAPNKDKALQLFTQYKFTKDASLHAAQLLESTKGDPGKIATMYREACFALQDVPSCKKAAVFYEKNKDDSDDWQARTLYANVCRLEPKDKGACNKVKAPPPKAAGKPGAPPKPKK